MLTSAKHGNGGWVIKDHLYQLLPFGNYTYCSLHSNSNLTINIRVQTILYKSLQNIHKSQCSRYKYNLHQDTLHIKLQLSMQLVQLTCAILVLLQLIIKGNSTLDIVAQCCGSSGKGPFGHLESIIDFLHFLPTSDDDSLALKKTLQIPLFLDSFIQTDS